MAQPTLLDYARFHGLAINHISQDLYSLLAPLEPLYADDGIPNLPDFEPPGFGNTVEEPKFQLNQHERHILTSSIARPASPDWKQLLPDHNRILDLKLEAPLLVASKGRAKDMAEFGFGEKIDLVGLLDDMPRYKAGEANGEVLDWPAELIGLAEEWEQEILNGKVSTTREVVLALQRMVRDSFTTEMKNEILKESLNVKKNKRLKPLTTVLVPMGMSPEPYLPSNPALQVMLRSDPMDLESPFSREILQEMEKEDQVDAEDLVTERGAKMDDFLRLAEKGPTLKPLKEISEQTTPLKAPRRRQPAEDLKLEVPLSPPDTNEKTKQVSENITFEEYVKDFFPVFCEVGGKIPEYVVDEEMDDELVKLAENAAREAELQIQQEKIEAPDLTARLQVPQLKAVRVEAPWERRSRIDTDGFVARLLETESHIIPLPIDPENNLELNWIPFSAKLTSLSLEETIEDEARYLTKATAPPTGILKSAQMLWRPERLKLLDSQDECEEEIEEDAYLLEEEPSITALKPLKTVPLKRSYPQAQYSLHKNWVMHPPLVPPSWHKPQRSFEPQSASLDVFNTTFSAAGSLDDFMETRGEACKKPKLFSNYFFKSSVIDDIESTQDSPLLSVQAESHNRDMVLVPATPVRAATQVVTAQPPSSTLCHDPFSVLPFEPLGSPRAVVLNNSLLQTRRFLVSFLESHATEHGTNSPVDEHMELRDKVHVRIIYRDLDLSFHASAHPSSTPSASPDLILSPTTCLLLTTLQALTQRPLPGQHLSSSGQSSFSIIHDRILNLVAEFDSVFLLVSHVLSPQALSGETSGLGATALSGNDSSTWTNFVAFCANLVDVAVVQPILVPVVHQPRTSKYNVVPPGATLPPSTQTRKSDPIQAWVWALIVRYAWPQSQHFSQLCGAHIYLNIQQNETTWSLFLRQCGLNPFAAQVVLCSLHERGVDEENNTTQGNADRALRRFVKMSREERIAMFGGPELLGRRTIERVSVVLDGLWG